MSCRFRAGALASIVMLTALAGCYSFSGGGGLPSHMRTVWVAPIENESTQFGIAESLMDELLTAARQRLGLRLASEEEAGCGHHGADPALTPMRRSTSTPWAASARTSSSVA